VVPRPLFVALLVVLAVVVRFATPGAPGSAQAPERTVHRPFPQALVATAGRPLPQPGAPAWDRMQQHMASIDAMWGPLFAAAGDRYDAPHLVAAGRDGCDAPPPAGNWAGIYCPTTRNIVVDLDSHSVRNTRTGGYVADVVLGYILAHEVGHHVQMARGAAPSEYGPRYELHADCLAGVWGKAAGLPLPPTWKYASDGAHGTSAQRMRWLSRGWLNARPADCDTIFSGEPL
jgi:predicted metalloprotease